MAKKKAKAKAMDFKTRVKKTASSMKRKANKFKKNVGGKLETAGKNLGKSIKKCKGNKRCIAAVLGGTAIVGGAAGYGIARSRNK